MVKGIDKEALKRRRSDTKPDDGSKEEAAEKWKLTIRD